MRLNALCLFFLFCFSLGYSQGTKEDYEKSQNLRKKSRGLLTHEILRSGWDEDDRYFWYKSNVALNKHAFFVVDLESGKKKQAFDSQKLATALKEMGRNVNADKLPINYLKFSADYQTITFIIGREAFECKLPAYEIRTVEREPKAPEILEDKQSSSGRGSVPTVITVKNATKKKLVIDWVNYKGKLIRYAEIEPGKSYDSNSGSGHVWVLSTADKRPVKIFRLRADPNFLEIVDEDLNSRKKKKPNGISPDDKWLAFIKDYNLYVKELASGKLSQLSADGTKQDFYTDVILWSPDSSKLICMKKKDVEIRRVTIVESSPEGQLQPKIHSYRYTKPGDPLPFIRPQLFDIKSLTQIQVNEDQFLNPYKHKGFRWSQDGSEFRFVHARRGFQELKVIAIDAGNGNVRSIVHEKAESFISFFTKFYMHQMDETGELIWMSERDGWNHLYLYDMATGKVKNQITKGEWVVRKVMHVDPKKREIFFQASGLDADQDPYHIHICRINFDGSDFTRLTSGDGTHAINVSPKGNFILDNWSRVDQPPVNEIRRMSDGAKVCDLEQANWDHLVKSGWTKPVRFYAKGRDGKTDIWGIIIFPSSFDEKKKYPVVEQIYAGPHDSHVQKSFNMLYAGHEIAELGFVVVKIDGMGTSNRSKAFHDYCWRNLGDAGFPDRILWMKAAAKKFPQMDISRVGITGGSAGGQNALRALIAHHDFYKVAIADCGCHDNRMDKIWWNEQWMGWPVGKHYEESSNVVHAHKMQGKLLLTVGELDRNVDPASTMQVVDALIKADKDFDLIVFPGKGHGAGFSPYGKKRKFRFLVRHLHGLEPEF